MCLYLYLYNISVFILLRSSIIVYHQTIHYKVIQNELSNTKTEIHLYRICHKKNCTQVKPGYSASII